MSISTKRQNYHHGDLRNALLDAGSVAAHEQGTETLSLRDVARRAGVSHTAAYNHFTDKNDLLRSLALRSFAQLTAELQAATESPNGTLEELAGAYIGFALRNAAEFRLMFSRSLCMPDGQFDPLEQAGKESQAVLMKEILRLQRVGEISAGNAEAIALSVWAQVHGITTIVLETPVFTSVSREIADQLARQGMRALMQGIELRA